VSTYPTQLGVKKEPSSLRNTSADVDSMEERVARDVFGREHLAHLLEPKPVR
jgi:hypothetical protein